MNIVTDAIYGNITWKVGVAAAHLALHTPLLPGQVFSPHKDHTRGFSQTCTVLDHHNSTAPRLVTF